MEITGVINICEAFRDGYEASYEMIPVNENPYNKESDVYVAWRYGHKVQTNEISIPVH